jgi:4-hydroxy-tetrahydrodipicolinate reductase
MTTPASKANAVRVVIIGASGRMGQALLRAAPAHADLRISAAIAAPGNAALGRDAGELAGLPASGVPVSSDLAGALAGADVAIDFSSGAATRANLAACRAAGTPLLIGTTGYPAAHETEFVAAAREIALLVTPNTSLGITLMLELVRLAARALPVDFDIDVLDLHHRTKRDAPSGTALAMGAAARDGRGDDRGAAARGRDVAFASVRAGDVVGEHCVLFSGASEQLSITHRAVDRAVFARGALTAALWLSSKPAGRYSMSDVIAIKTAT